MNSTITNGAPQLINLGTDDKSKRPYVRAPIQIPQHLPKYFIFAEKGPLTEELVSGDEAVMMYGEKTFIEKSPYFNHATRFFLGTNAQGNISMIKRLKAPNCGPKPSIRLYMDVLPTLVDDYERNTDGSIKTDVAGDPIVAGTVAGFRVKFMTSFFATEAAAETDFGAGTIIAGDQTDGKGRSQRYPIMDIEHNFFGKDGMLAGVRLWAQNEDNVGTLPVKLINRDKVYPYSFSVVRKNSDTGNVRPVETIFGEQSLTVVFKEDIEDPLTGIRLYAGEQMIDPYQNLTDTRYPKKYGEFGRVHIYQENIETLLGLFHAAEVPFIDQFSDFTTATTDKHLFNFVTGTSTKNVPYHSFVFTDTGNSVRLSSASNVFAKGGSDGDMTHENHALLVKEYMDRYKNPDDELMDVAYHVESHFYDSGYPLETKYALINAVSVRKDTVVVTSPTEFGQRSLTASEEYSVSASLRAYADLYPDSTYFGTPLFRVTNIGSAGRIRGSKYKERFPLTYEVAIKSAKYMGAANGAWKSGENFDGQPGSLIDNQFDLTNTWTPVSVRLRNWDIGLNWIQREDRSMCFFPAVKTLYSDDTSVLNSYELSCAIAYMHKVLAKIQRQFSGVSHLTPAQFTERVNDAFSAEVRGKFDGRYKITPRAQFTSMDEIRNFSWTMPVDIYAPGMYTVMTGYIVARRIQDYTGE